MILRALDRVPRPPRSLLLLLLVAADSRCSLSGEATNPDAAPPASATGGDAPAPKHEDVVFRWRRSDPLAPSGEIEAELPDGEAFSGRFHEVTVTTQVADISDFYATWYGAPWADSRWFWGDTWPRLGSVEEFIINYTGKVVATLTSRGGIKMRCRFRLDEPDRRMAGGGSGECQLSNGERITAKLLPT